MTIEQALASVVELMPPPIKPFEAPRATDWERCEAALGTSLPSDFKLFLAQYGVGAVDHIVSILSPASEGELALDIQAMAVLQELRRLKAFDDRWARVDMFPQKGGVLPFANIEGGGHWVWETKGEPDEWTVAVATGDEPRFESSRRPFLKFLHAVLSREFTARGMPRDFALERPVPYHAPFAPR